MATEGRDGGAAARHTLGVDTRGTRRSSQSECNASRQPGRRGGAASPVRIGCRARVVASPRGMCWATRRPLAAQPQARARVDRAARSCPRLPHAARQSRGCGSVADSPERASAAPESRVGHPQPSFIPPKPRGGGGTATAWRAGPRERHTGEGEKPSQRVHSLPTAPLGAGLDVLAEPDTNFGVAHPIASADLASPPMGDARDLTPRP